MRRNRAFTLIELLIVVAIIGILAAIAVPNFLDAQIRSKVARAHSEERTIAVALDSYMADHGSYPPIRQCTSFEDYAGYRYLTTPVAYLHTMLADPFSIRYEANRRNEFDTAYEFALAKHGGESNDMFEIECVGPDGDDDFRPSFAFPSHPDIFQFYDSSNGIRSNGDILRAGGTYVPRWFRERRGGQRTPGQDWI